MKTRTAQLNNGRVARNPRRTISRTLNAALAASLLACAVLAQSAVQQAPTVGRQQFLSAWMGRSVVLKKAMYSIAYDGPSGQGITVVSPDKGTFFQIQTITHSDRGFRIAAPLLDRDQQQLFDKVSAQLGSGSSPKLLTFKIGSRLKASARFIDESRNEFSLDERIRLAIDLYDDLNEKDRATILWVQWPNGFSAEFNERRQVETLIAEFLTPTTPPR